jgi:hypothetical protein
VDVLLFDAKRATERATEVAAALIETLDDARVLQSAGWNDPELVAIIHRARDLQERFRSLVAVAGPQGDGELAAICASTGVIVAHLWQSLAGRARRRAA